MTIKVNDKGYVTGWNLVDDGTAIYCKIPQDFEKFSKFYRGYRYADGELVEDPVAMKELQLFHQQEEIRRQREDLCFPYVNRGALWYENLTQDQRVQLGQWYQAWLDAPKTMTIPEAPEWLK